MPCQLDTHRLGMSPLRTAHPTILSHRARTTNASGSSYNHRSSSPPAAAAAPPAAPGAAGVPAPAAAGARAPAPPPAAPPEVVPLPVISAIFASMNAFLQERRDEQQKNVRAGRCDEVPRSPRHSHHTTHIASLSAVSVPDDDVVNPLPSTPPCEPYRVSVAPPPAAAIGAIRRRFAGGPAGTPRVLSVTPSRCVRSCTGGKWSTQTAAGGRTGPWASAAPSRPLRCLPTHFLLLAQLAQGFQVDATAFILVVTTRTLLHPFPLAQATWLALWHRLRAAVDSSPAAVGRRGRWRRPAALLHLLRTSRLDNTLIGARRWVGHETVGATA